MNWLLIILMATANTEEIEPVSQAPKANEPQAEHNVEKPLEPSLELLLFLAEWEDSDNDQWLDPEIFATDDSINLQLDLKKVKHNETDTDHN